MNVYQSIKLLVDSTPNGRRNILIGILALFLSALFRLKVFNFPHSYFVEMPLDFFSMASLCAVFLSVVLRIKGNKSFHALTLVPGFGTAINQAMITLYVLFLLVTGVFSWFELTLYMLMLTSLIGLSVFFISRKTSNVSANAKERPLLHRTYIWVIILFFLVVVRYFLIEEIWPVTTTQFDSNLSKMVRLLMIIIVIGLTLLQFTRWPKTDSSNYRLIKVKSWYGKMFDRDIEVYKDKTKLFFYILGPSFHRVMIFKTAIIPWGIATISMSYAWLIRYLSSKHTFSLVGLTATLPFVILLAITTIIFWITAGYFIRCKKAFMQAKKERKVVQLIPGFIDLNHVNNLLILRVLKIALAQWLIVNLAIIPWSLFMHWSFDSFDPTTLTKFMLICASIQLLLMAFNLNSFSLMSRHKNTLPAELPSIVLIVGSAIFVSKYIDSISLTQALVTSFIGASVAAVAMFSSRATMIKRHSIFSE